MRTASGSAGGVGGATIGAGAGAAAAAADTGALFWRSMKAISLFSVFTSGYGK